MIRPLRLLLSRLAVLWNRCWMFKNMPNVTITGTRPIGSVKITDPVISLPRDMTGEVSRTRTDRIQIEPSVSRVQSSTNNPIVVVPQRRRSTVSVEREPSLYWQDKGWQRKGDVYYGYFGSNGRRWHGAITWSRRGFRYCFIYDPPWELWSHIHAPCFSPIGDGGYTVHFTDRPRTIDAAIITVESILSEATGRRA